MHPTVCNIFASILSLAICIYFSIIKLFEMKFKHIQGERAKEREREGERERYE